MAIDTALKRRSAAGVLCVGMPASVTPDGTKPKVWRQVAAWGYGGIEVPTVGTGSVIDSLVLHGGSSTRLRLFGGTSASLTVEGGTNRRLRLR